MWALVMISTDSSRYTWTGSTEPFDQASDFMNSDAACSDQHISVLFERMVSLCWQSPDKFVASKGKYLRQINASGLHLSVWLSRLLFIFGDYEKPSLNRLERCWLIGFKRRMPLLQQSYTSFSFCASVSFFIMPLIITEEGGVNDIPWVSPFSFLLTLPFLPFSTSAPLLCRGLAAA